MTHLETIANVVRFVPDVEAWAVLYTVGTMARMATGVEIAREAGVSLRTAARVLAILGDMQLVWKRAGTYRNTPALREALRELRDAFAVPRGDGR